MPGVVSGMTFNIAAGFLQFDSNGFLKAHKMAMIKAMKSAAKIWLTTAISRIPKDTGFLRSGFFNLAAFLGVRITASGTIKRGRDLYGQQQKLAHLQQRYGILKDRLIQGGHIEQSGKGKYKRVTPKPQKFNKRREESRKYLYNKNKAQSAKAESAHAKEQAGQASEEGLSIHKNADDNIKKSLTVYKREKNREYYERQREQKKADKAIKQLRKLQQRLKDQKNKVEAAASREKPMRTKEHPGYDRWEKVEIEKTVYETREVEELNPAYPTNPRELLARKKAGTLPPKTIKVLKKVPVIIKKTVKRRITGERRLVDIYRKYYYPRNGIKGPLKTPLGGTEYGTAVDDILKLNNSKIPSGQIATQTETINRMGFEVNGPEIAHTNLTPESSLNRANAKFASNTKIILSFNYAVNIRYLRIMDIFKPRRKDGRTYSGAPWGAFAAANKIFMQILRDEYTKIAPPFTSYVVVAKGTLKTPGFKGSI